ncbi:MAG TPA: hypothetical protein VFH13_04920, partial [Gemmatimonadaceae bacterium]|nr:hypothetical protein [Gemmatimonadaceae bacterium]
MEKRREGEHGARGFQKGTTGEGHDGRIVNFGLWIDGAPIRREFTPSRLRCRIGSCSTYRKSCANVFGSR